MAVTTDSRLYIVYDVYDVYFGDRVGWGRKTALGPGEKSEKTQIRIGVFSKKGSKTLRTWRKSFVYEYQTWSIHIRRRFEGSGDDVCKAVWVFPFYVSIVAKPSDRFGHCNSYWYENGHAFPPIRRVDLIFQTVFGLPVWEQCLINARVSTSGRTQRTLSNTDDCQIRRRLPR